MTLSLHPLRSLRTSIGLYTMLTIKKLRKAMGGRTLFEDADMVINWGERVALVGANGTGKSTIFKIILGKEEKDSGTINIDEYGMVGYLEQEAGNPGEATILEIATGISDELRDAMARSVKESVTAQRARPSSRRRRTSMRNSMATSLNPRPKRSSRVSAMLKKTLNVRRMSFPEDGLCGLTSLVSWSRNQIS